jgi:hypothetical protein
MPHSDDRITITLEDWTTHCYQANESLPDFKPEQPRHLHRTIRFPSPEEVQTILFRNRDAGDSDPTESKKILGELISTAKAHSAAVSEDYRYERDKEAIRVEKASSEGKNLIWEGLLFTDEARHIIEMVFGAGGAAAFLKGCKDSLIAVLNYKVARLMRVEKGGLSITLQGSSATPEEMAKLIALAETTPTNTPEGKTQETSAGAQKSARVR